jgi:hypothetical protein
MYMYVCSVYMSENAVSPAAHGFTVRKHISDHRHIMLLRLL